MKKLTILILLLFSSIFYTNSQDNDTIYVVHGVTIDTKIENTYCKGFKEGYVDGFCYKKLGCIKPIPPICPIRSINEENNYKGGYQRGFKLGLSKKENG